MKTKNILIALCLVLPFFTQAQKANMRKGNYQYERMAYSKAIPFYIKALKKDSTIQDGVFRLADSYRKTNNRERAEYWYSVAVTMPKCDPIYKFYYGQSLMNNGKYAQARKWMENFAIESKTDGRGQKFIRAIDMYQSFFADSNNYALTRLDINSKNADFGAALYNDGIVFTSSREQTQMVSRTHSWTNEPFLALYYSRGKENKFREPEVFSNTMQTKFNDGPVCFNKKGDEIFITRNNIENGKVHKSSAKVVKLKIMSAKNTGRDEWSKLESFPYNSDEYSCAHPAISPDGMKLYFASDMPGTKGGMDLWMCAREGKGWSKPINLGDTINGKGNEVFPVVMDDGTLYFSSDGHAGIGGLDIFYSREFNGKYLIPMNVGYPLNTSDDDFGMVYDVKNKVGYLSSNRANKGFDDDIYSFRKKTIRIKGIVVNRETGEPIKSAQVDFSHDNKNIKFTTEENGRFDFAADFEKTYTIKAHVDGLGDSTAVVNTSFASPADPFVRIELGNKSYAYGITITVIDAETRLPIATAEIKDELNDIKIGSTNSAGVYKQPLVADKDEQFMVTKRGYRSRVIMLDGVPEKAMADKNVLVELKPVKDIWPYEDWYKIIYFDLDKSDIRADAEKTMNEIAAMLKAHPEIKISMTSSTDSRATAQYNQRLSERRSKSAKKYLMDHGIPSKQIGRFEWTGESVLVNNCGDGVPCTEVEHQLNRRTEFKVIELLKTNVTSEK